MKLFTTISISLMALVIAGCSAMSTIAPPVLDAGLQTLVGEKAIAKQDTPTVYSCWGGTQSLNDWKPVAGTFGLWPNTVVVVDEGYMFTVDTPAKNGVFESKELYSTVKDYVDVGVDLNSITRYYRINHPSLMYVKSDLNTTGSGTATILFNCNTDSARVADPSTVKVIE